MSSINPQNTPHGIIVTNYVDSMSVYIPRMGIYSVIYHMIPHLHHQLDTFISQQ